MSYQTGMLLAGSARHDCSPWSIRAVRRAGGAGVGLDDHNREPQPLGARAAVAAGRGALTSATVLATLWLIETTLPDDGDWVIVLLIALSLTLLPAVALACAAPRFRISDYMLNGLYAVVLIPLVFYVFYDYGDDRIADPAPAWIFAAILISAPALLGLGTSALVWGVIRKAAARRDEQAETGPVGA